MQFLAITKKSIEVLAKLTKIAENNGGNSLIR
jgi:hypothetical protein